MRRRTARRRRTADPTSFVLSVGAERGRRAAPGRRAPGRQRAAAAAVALALGMPVAEIAATLRSAGHAVALADGGARARRRRHRHQRRLQRQPRLHARGPERRSPTIGRRGPAPTVAVLGEMRELGESSDEEHDAVGRLAVRPDVHARGGRRGGASRSTTAPARKGPGTSESVFVRDVDAARRALRGSVAAGRRRAGESIAGSGLERSPAALTAGDADRGQEEQSTMRALLLAADSR